jgi:hypothetical protein
MDATTLPLGSFRGRAILHVVTRLSLRGLKERGAFDAAKSTSVARVPCDKLGTSGHCVYRKLHPAVSRQMSHCYFPIAFLTQAPVPFLHVADFKDVRRGWDLRDTQDT